MFETGKELITELVEEGGFPAAFECVRILTEHCVVGPKVLAGAEAALQALIPETAAPSGGDTALATGTVKMDARVKAKMQGYEGDPCGDCGNYTLVRNGTCMKCNTCGATSGCS